MLNSVLIVGRITKIEKTDEKVHIQIGIQRDYKNINGKYETDLIDTIVSQFLSDKVKECYEVGDLIVVKGRLATNNVVLDEKIKLVKSKGE